MVRIGLASLASAAVLLVACGTDASGIDSCRKIEEARCRRAPGCGMVLDKIRYVGSTPEEAVQGCIRHYREACLHGTIVQDPGPTSVQSCVSAVTTGSCDVVKTPESSADCAWLIPPAEVADAAPAAPDAGTDATR